MSKHLFLEGPVRAGKSTLLRQCLAPYRNLLGGFSVQRLLAPDGAVQAYRMTSAREFCLQRDWHPALPGIFLQRSTAVPEQGISPETTAAPVPAISPVMEVHPEVFSCMGVTLLHAGPKHQLILLDEIGGVELLVPAFRHALSALLAGNISCIGVIKQQRKAVSLRRATSYPAQLDTLHRQLRNHLLTQWDARILSFPAAASSSHPELPRHSDRHTSEVFRTTGRARYCDTADLDAGNSTAEISHRALRQTIAAFLAEHVTVRTT